MIHFVLSSVTLQSPCRVLCIQLSHILSGLSLSVLEITFFDHHFSLIFLGCGKAKIHVSSPFC